MTDAQERTLHELRIELAGHSATVHSSPIHYGPDAPLLVSIFIPSVERGFDRLILANGKLI